MSYSHLPVEERIKKAAEYTVLLLADDRPDIDIIAELKETFELTEEEAKSAYSRMRQIHDKEFNITMQDKIKRAWTLVILSLLFGISYGAFASVTTGFYLIFVFIFGAGFSGGLSMIAKWTREMKTTPEEGFFSGYDRQKKLTQSKQNDWTTSVPFVFLFLLMFAWFSLYSNNRIVDVNEIRRIDGLIVSDKIEKKSTGGKNRTYYYEFYFADNKHKFRFLERYYSYANLEINNQSFTSGDTISIEIKEKQINEFRAKDEINTIDIINVTSGNKWVINHGYRNKKVEYENKRNFLIIGVGYLLSNIIVFLWLRYRKPKKGNK